MERWTESDYKHYCTIIKQCKDDEKTSMGFVSPYGICADSKALKSIEKILIEKNRGYINNLHF